MRALVTMLFLIGIAISPVLSSPASAACGDRGGPGYRGSDGKCVSWGRLYSDCGNPPETHCTAENVNREALRRNPPSAPNRSVPQHAYPRQVNPPAEESFPEAERRIIIDPVDGDTVVVRARLVGFDTPEINGRCPYERELAQAAKRRLGELIPYSVFTRVDCGGGANVDKYGRMCALLTIEGRNVGDILIAEGLARPYDCNGGCPRRQPWCG